MSSIDEGAKKSKKTKMGNIEDTEQEKAKGSSKGKAQKKGTKQPRKYPPPLPCHHLLMVTHTLFCRKTSAMHAQEDAAAPPPSHLSR
jgi:hypothetical protein